MKTKKTTYLKLWKDWYHRGFPSGSVVKNPLAMQETRGWEYPLEEEMAIHSSILACKIPWIGESGEQQSKRLQRVGHDWATDHNITQCNILKLICNLTFPIKLAVFYLRITWQSNFEFYLVKHMTICNEADIWRKNNFEDTALHPIKINKILQ